MLGQASIRTERWMDADWARHFTVCLSGLEVGLQSHFQINASSSFIPTFLYQKLHWAAEDQCELVSICRDEGPGTAPGPRHHARPPPPPSSPITPTLLTALRQSADLHMYDNSWLWSLFWREQHQQQLPLCCVTKDVFSPNFKVHVGCYDSVLKPHPQLSSLQNCIFISVCTFVACLAMLKTGTSLTVSHHFLRIYQFSLLLSPVSSKYKTKSCTQYWWTSQMKTTKRGELALRK